MNLPVGNCFFFEQIMKWFSGVWCADILQKISNKKKKNNDEPQGETFYNSLLGRNLDQ